MVKARKIYVKNLEELFKAFEQLITRYGYNVFHVNAYNSDELFEVKAWKRK